MTLASSSSCRVVELEASRQQMEDEESDSRDQRLCSRSEAVRHKRERVVKGNISNHAYVSLETAREKEGLGKTPERISVGKPCVRTGGRVGRHSGRARRQKTPKDGWSPRSVCRSGR